MVRSEAKRNVSGESEGEVISYNEASLLGGDVVFTAEEMLHFMDKEARMLEDVEDANVGLNKPKGALTEQRLETLGVDKQEVEEKMIELAFRTFAPELPIIPPEGVLEVLGYRKAQKLGTAYKLGSRVSWSTLKERLIEKREEVLTAYRNELMSHANRSSAQASLLKRKLYRSNIGSRAYKRRRSSQDSADAADSQDLPAPIIRGRSPQREKALPFDKPLSPRPISPLVIPDGPRHIPSSWVKEEPLSSFVPSEDQNTAEVQGIKTNSAQPHLPIPPEHQHDPSATRVGKDGSPSKQSKIPCFVNMRRKRGRDQATRKDQPPFVERLKEALHRGDSIPGFRPHRSRDNTANTPVKLGGSSRLPRPTNPKDNFMGPPRDSILPAHDSTVARRNAVNKRYIPASPVFRPPRSPIPSPAFRKELNKPRPLYTQFSPGSSRGSRFCGSSLIRERDVEELTSADSTRLYEGHGQIEGLGEQALRNGEDILEGNSTVDPNRGLRTNLSTPTHDYDDLQLAPSPECQPENPEVFEDYDSDDNDALQGNHSMSGTSIHDDPGSISSARPSHFKESHSTVTLQRLAQIRDELANEKRARAKDSQKPYDLMTSPDPDYSLDEAYRSPRETRFYCAFTFRGFHVMAPVTGERARRAQSSRRRRPEWYIRKDPESPTPAQRTLPRSNIPVLGELLAMS